MKQENSGKTKRRRLSGGNREILVITYIFVGLFIGIILYVSFFTAFKSADLINNSYNKRQDLLAKRVVRGDILSREGEILATTITDEDGNEDRVYPFNGLFSHAVGYSTHGKSGVELISNFKLLTSNIFIGDRIKNDLNGIKNPGDTVITTLDLDVQKIADAALEDHRGAIILANVQTGELLAMVSKPNFDANTVGAFWEEINADGESSALLNRATQGLYPPGSTFKIVTALAYLQEHPEISDYEFSCSGSFEYQGNVINCYHGQKHGMVDFSSSFAKSCNSSFANISTELNKRKFKNTCDDLQFNSSLPIPYVYRESSISLNANSPVSDVMQTAIGQGKTMITPYHMNLITCAIANDGILMKPYVVAEVESAYGDLVESTKPTEYGRLMSAEQAQQLQILMAEVVQSGTGTRVRDTVGYSASGKTGSAEYSTDKKRSHAWFTGFAGDGQPEVAITVIVEDGGSGGEVAVPIAKMVFDAYFAQR